MLMLVWLWFVVGVVLVTVMCVGVVYDADVGVGVASLVVDVVYVVWLFFDCVNVVG